MIEEQLADLTTQRTSEGGPAPSAIPLPNGSFLIVVPEVEIGAGWNRAKADVLFVAPPGYPAAQPDCFWVQPTALRLENGATPQSSNDANPIPGDIDPSRSTTWFSWHLQVWDPNRSSLLTFYKVILNRLKPAR